MNFKNSKVPKYAMNFFIFIAILSFSNCYAADDFFKSLIEAFIRDMRRNLFEKPSLKDFPKLPEINSLVGERRFVSYHEHTMAIVDVNISNEIIRCDVVNVNQIKEINEDFLQLSAAKVQVDFEDMLEITKKCGELDYDPAHVADVKKVQESAAMTLLLRGIFPGTKWCGQGDIAKGYHDLGEFQEEDRCCRAHDLCPLEVPRNGSYQNIQNTGLITISHCACNEIFHDCLKNVGTKAASCIGYKFFNILKPVCMEDDLSNTEIKTLHRQQYNDLNSCWS